MDKKEFDALSADKQAAYLATASEEVRKALKGDKSTQGLKQLDMKEFEAKIEGVVKDAIKGMTPTDKKFFVFPGIGSAKDLLDDRSPEAKFAKTKKFLSALVGGDVKIARDMSNEVAKKANLNESTGAQGAFLVPEEFAAEILRLAPTYGVARRECRIIPMKYDVMNIPTAGTTNLTAHWTNEASQIYTTNPNFRQLALTINKLATIPKVTSELLQDANVAVVQYLAELAAEQFAKGEDVECFIGTGSPFVGILTATGVPSRATAGTGFECLSYVDLVKTPATTYALTNAKYYFHRSMIAHMRGLITTAGAPILPATANAVAGYPVVPVEVIPAIGHAAYQTTATTYAVFGDLRKGMIMGERGTVEMKISTEGTVLGDNLFEKDMTAMRFIERVAFGVALPSAFVIIKTG